MLNDNCWAIRLIRNDLLGNQNDNQIDRGTAIDFHVSHMASPVATGEIWWAKPTQIIH